MGIKTIRHSVLEGGITVAIVDGFSLIHWQYAFIGIVTAYCYSIVYLYLLIYLVFDCLWNPLLPGNSHELTYHMFTKSFTRVCVCVCVTNWWPNDVYAMNIECHLIYVCIYNNWIHLSYCYDMWERKWRKRNRRFSLFTSIIFFQVAISTITNIDWLPLKINNSLAMSLHLSPSFVCIRNHIPAIDSQNNCIRKYTFRIYFDVFV